MPITFSLSISTLVAQFSGSESSRNSGGERIFDRDLVRLELLLGSFCVLFEVRDEVIEDEASRSTGLLFAVDGKSTILNRDRPLLLDMARGFYECIFVRKSINWSDCKLCKFQIPAAENHVTEWK
jgi:hypothetical protein